MGDSSQVTAGNAFTKLLRYLEPIHRQPTIDENDLLEPSVRLAELARHVRTQDCVVALGTAEMRSQLCITFLLTLKPSRAVIVGEKICEDADFLDYLRLFISHQVRVVSATTSYSPDEFRDAYLIVEPEVLWTLLKDGVLRTSDIDALVLRDFELYLDAGHAYCKVLSCFQPPAAASSTRILALADGLQAGSIEDLERYLRRLRTPLRLNCRLGTPAAPYAREVLVELCPLEVDWSGNGDWRWAIDVVSCSNDPKVRDVGAALSEWGISVASDEALNAFATTPSNELGEFLLLSRMALTPLKGYAVLNYVQGRTLALTNTAASMHDLDKWLRQEGSATVIDQPDEVALALSVVLVATTADMPTLKRYCWDAVVLCDLPFGVSCDALFANADRKVALATEREWKRWTELLEVHDELDKLLIRVNELSVLY
ncbi:hypothetical protein HPB52_018754 [Rhipicephalus sanguineus]|uniref:Uncharacterized protein n=1 Tax=Rhipicephalus sanguineus TaxID=34632 RepID=A0A9D4Q7V0_RHISA|nr:hypothetical protein HPB52_018754 [Rhipicephalus sanguineus]